jgi:hypothetical protein
VYAAKPVTTALSQERQQVVLGEDTEEAALPADSPIARMVEGWTQPKKGTKGTKDKKVSSGKAKQKMTGQGSKLGAYRRDQGASDNNIAGLAEEDAKELTANTVETGQWDTKDKIAVVKFICKNEAKFKDFKVNKARHY